MLIPGRKRLSFSMHDSISKRTQLISCGVESAMCTQPAIKRFDNQLGKRFSADSMIISQL